MDSQRYKCLLFIWSDPSVLVKLEQKGALIGYKLDLAVDAEDAF